jgi:hypothetical protein
VASPSGDPAGRDEVLGWMQRTGSGYALAADHFGLKRDTVKSWVRRYVKNAPARTDGRTSDETPAIRESDGGVRIPSGGVDSRSNPLAESRARATPPATAANFPEQDRSRLRGAVRRGLDVLDSDEGWKEPKKAADAARALKELMSMTPDLLMFDEKTSGRMDRDGAADRDARAARVRGALGADGGDGSGGG